jgi:argininosuccinate lyase
LKKMWSGRFAQPQDRAFETWQRSFPFDQRLLGEEVAASAAHARALEGAGVLSAGELRAVLDGLEQIAKLPVEEVAADQAAEDVHHFVEKRLAELIGEVGLKLHSGRSRNEQIATDLRLYTRRNIEVLQSQTLDLVKTFAERAEQSGNAAMPAYTHLQAAEPVLVAHWLLAYAEMFMRDHGRLGECCERLNQCPLGSGAVAGATLPLDREAVAAELAFDAPTANSIDATSDRDFAIEFVQAGSLLMLHLSRWAEEFILFSTREYGFVRLPESYSTGSSAMPQKKNPDALELIRGKSARVIGNLVSLLTTVKALPLAYNKDLQETQQPLFDTAETALSSVKIATGFMREVGFAHARMQAAAEEGHSDALAAATYLLQRGVPFRSAHEQIGKAVRYCLEKGKGCNLEELSLEELRQFAPQAGEDFYSYLSLNAVLAAHDVPGGTNPQRVQEALARLREQLTLLRGGVHANA